MVPPINHKSRTQGADVSTSQFRPVAIKILNPVGFRLAPAATLRRCVVARRGQLVGGGGGSSGGGGGDTNGLGGGGVPPSDSSGPSSFSGSMGGGVSATGTGFSSVGGGSGRVGTAGMGMGGRPCKLGPEHVWWLVSPNTKQVLAAYIDPRYGSLVELPLPKVRVFCFFFEGGVISLIFFLRTKTAAHSGYFLCLPNKQKHQNVKTSKRNTSNSLQI